MHPMQLAEYAGFTEEEVRGLCNEYEMSYDDISGWYNGYNISNTIPVNMRKLYNDGEYSEHRFPIYSRYLL